MIEEELREKLRKHINKYGTSLAFIGRQINVHRCTLSLFINNKRGLPKQVQLRIKTYLHEFDN